MKTISSPMQHWRGLCVSSTLACALLAGGLALSGASQAQTAGNERTLATGTRLPLATDAPNTYTVKPGDTLWGISQTFLSQPWYWPELWYLNPKIQNPHLIYPGDVLSLVTIDGQTRLTVTERGQGQVTSGGAVRLSPEVRSEPLSQAITTIPYNVVAAFLGKPSMLNKDEVKTGPHLINVRDNHIIGSAGNEVYATGINTAVEGARYNVVHVEEALRDPENNDLLGYRGNYVGSGAVIAAGNPAKLALTETAREALPGDKLFAETYRMNLDFVPHAPSSTVEGSIFAIDGLAMVGRYQVVAINRGTKAGLETGSVLAIYQAGQAVKDVYSDGLSANPMYTPNGLFKKKIQLPDERAGTVLIFKTYERMSYALIMDSTHPIKVGDRVKNP
ncbi:MAG: LysM domain-containing protein [Steroidobacteraceae bacterium]